MGAEQPGAPGGTGAILSVLEWNVHWGVSRVPDRQQSAVFDPFGQLERSVLERADVVILPESWRGHNGESFLDRLSEFGFHSVTETKFRTLDISVARRQLTEPGEGWWELAVATRHPVVRTVELPLARSFHDAVPIRNAVSVRIAVDDHEVDVTAFHVSSKLWFGAPIVQLRSLARLLAEHDLDGSTRPAIIAGDGNIWRTWIPSLLPGWRMAVKGRTFPSWRPHSQIDHICARGAIDVVEGKVLPYSPTSDHRAICARLQLR